MARVIQTSIPNAEAVSPVSQPISENEFSDSLAGINELLIDSAPVALAKSRELCGAPVGGEKSTGGQNCKWLHGSHQYLLLLGLAATPERNLKFYRQELLRASYEMESQRILISGCCDYMMLAIVLEVYKERGVRPQITIVDRCDTPLYLCQWFADRQGCEITTQQSSILTYEPEEPFDLVCTDGLISNFWPEVRVELVAAWHKVLKSGGFVVTTNNIQPGQWGENTQNSPATVSAICEKAAEINAKLPIKLDLPSDKLYALTRDYLSHPTAPAVRSIEELKVLFHPDQFRLKHLEVSEIDGLTFKDADETGKIQKTLNARIVTKQL